MSVKRAEKKKVPGSTFRKGSLLYNISRYRYLFILVLPALITALIFSYFPMPYIVMAFQDFSIFDGIFKSEWVGLEHFKTIFTMPKFTFAIKNTLVYSITTLIATFPLPIILSLLFNELRNLRFKKIVQTVSYMPHFLSWASIIAIIYLFFATYGTYNDALVAIFGDSYERANPVMDSDNMLAFIIGSNVWKGLGWSTVVYMAAIAGVDPSLYEAAKLDGANRFQQVIHVTLPSILPTAIILLIMSAGGIFSSNFEQVYGLQNLYTQEATEVINTLTYRQGIGSGNYSLATAFGLFQGLVALILTLIVNKVSKKTAEISLW